MATKSFLSEIAHSGWVFFIKLLSQLLILGPSLNVHHYRIKFYFEQGGNGKTESTASRDRSKVK